MRISDQTAALKLAICDDIGERSYDFADVAAILVQILLRHPAVGEWFNSLRMRYYVLSTVHHTYFVYLQKKQAFSTYHSIIKYGCFYHVYVY
jgi:hypothetical protein